jgi:hypothetical protein
MPLPWRTGGARIGADTFMFSQRFKWSLESNRFARLIEEKKRSGARILDLTESKPFSLILGDQRKRSGQFMRSLRKEDQQPFDELFERARLHALADARAATPQLDGVDLHLGAEANFKGRIVRPCIMKYFFLLHH